MVRNGQLLMLTVCSHANKVYLSVNFSRIHVKKKKKPPNLDFKSELSGGFRVKHTVGLQSSSLVQGEEFPVISRHDAKLKGRAIPRGVFIAD